MNKKILYLITEDWFFCSHFIERAVAARQSGYDVVVVAREGVHGKQIRDAGLRLVPLEIQRRGINPFKEMATIFRVLRIYRAERPDIVHHIALKPIFYGSFIARLTGLKNIVNAPVGMGFIFSSSSVLAKSLRPFVNLAMRFLLNPRGSCVVFENQDDLNDAISTDRVRQSDAVLIRGAGINLDAFPVKEEPTGKVTVVLTARMLWDKGVGEYVAAARLLLQRQTQARFLLVGAPDIGNPAAISLQQLEDWEREKVIEWLGHRQDIPEILSNSHIVCLPSYREGLPKSLLEALAAGRPVVTTDVPGCREVVRHEENGLLVPPKEVLLLAEALARLIDDADLRRKQGRKGRQRAEQEFSSQEVIGATLDLYGRYDSCR
ncbi:glycosyltransferase family 4 protein [Herbaspirillum rhizosphaerae]|uniref:Glycosyltransferase family 4 protein n=1 Tax=Herbaspirillum rhizosphaerae TaxID=346179 RepID=A0ABW8Z9X3_9BURK